MKSVLSHFVIALVFLSWPAAASSTSEANRIYAPTSAQEVGMIFYKLAKQKPDFKDWVMHSKAFAQIPDEGKGLYLQQEAAKLQLKYSALTIAKQPIVIKAAVEMTLKEDGVPRILLKFPDGPIYFPYRVGSRDIALVANGFEDFKTIALNAEELALARAKMDPGRLSTMVLEIEPKAASASQVYKLDSRNYNILLGNVGFVGFYNSYLEPVWTYAAPGYTLKKQRGLIELKK